MNAYTIFGSIASSFIVGYMIALYEPVTSFGKVEASEFVEFEISYEPIALPKEDSITILTMLDVISDEEKHCLIENVYFESRGEPLIGQEAVVWVTLNRVFDTRYPADICKVIYQPKQFSWTANHATDEEIIASKEWQVATAVVEDVLSKYFTAVDPTEGSMFFHSTSVKPQWSEVFEKVVRINNHIFYKDNS